MKTFVLKAKDIKRDWYILDAAGKPIGRIAAKIASVLRGKNKPTFSEHLDNGDFVVVINADKAIFTGRKSKRKNYFHYSGYIGGLTTVSYKDMMGKKPTFPIESAVKGMLPKNNLARKVIKKMYLFSGSEHTFNHVELKTLDIE